MNYEEILVQVIALLQQEHRVAYRVLKRRLELDDDPRDFAENRVGSPSIHPIQGNHYVLSAVSA